MKILIIGNGKMGSTFKNLYGENVDVINGSDIFNYENKYDGVIDFSYPNQIEMTLEYCIKNKLPLVIGTTNYSQEQLKLIENASLEMPICLDSNYSLGILGIKKCIESLTKFKFEKIVITETHHKNKIDIPSGTSLSLKKYINKMFLNDVEIISFREDDNVGIHKIEFINKEETISIIHSVENRAIFAKGAKIALKFIKQKKAKLYDFGEIINGK